MMMDQQPLQLQLQHHEQVKQTLVDLVPEWSDKQKILFYFSKLPEEYIQPKQHREKLDFWHRILNVTLNKSLMVTTTKNHQNLTTLKWCYSDGDCIMTLFNNFGFTPVSLSDAWDIFVRNQTLVSVNSLVSKLAQLIELEGTQYFKFHSERNSFTSSTISIRATLDFLIDSLSSLFVSSASNNPIAVDKTKKPNQDEEFVFVPFLESLIKRLHSMVDGKILTLDEFLALLNSSQLSLNSFTKEDALIIVGYINTFKPNQISIKKSTLSGEEQFLIIKFSKDPLTSDQEGVVCLRKAILKAQSQLDELSLKEKRFVQQALEAKRNNNNLTMAKKFILSRKLLLPLIDRHLQQLNQLESILLQIENASTQASILRAYELGGRALEQVLKKEKLTVDKVDETMSYVQDVMANNSDIQNVIDNWQNDLVEAPSDEDLLRELDELDSSSEAQFATEKQKILEKLQSIPSIPVTVGVPDAFESVPDTIESQILLAED